jgi:4-hydroxybenzoate polyprenyltransferase
MIALLKLIRYKNLFMVLLTLVLTKYALINSFTSAINDLQFILVTIAILCITAGGYIINDIFDIETDKINKPSQVYIGNTISKEKAYFSYFLLSFIGLILGLYTSYINKTIFYGIFFIATIMLLYGYSKRFKSVAIIGNVIVAFLTALSIFIVYIFEVKTLKNSTNLLELIANFFASISVTTTVFIYIIFAFFMTLIREMIKDIEDMKGDYALKMKTLPIIIGINRTKKVILVITSIIFLFILIILKEELIHIPLLFWYTVLFILTPFTWFLYKLFTSKTSKNYHVLSQIIKLIMFFGILSMLLLKL